ncbi:MAG: hypothetical protein JW741_04215 [Sedimentisphaerales bacterium]|nr:hypothetical protein [Sedimentisphaerales bacterium]
MRTILSFLGFLCCLAAAGGTFFALTGESELLPAVFVLFFAGIVLLGLASILNRLAQIEFLLKASRAGGTKRVGTELGDFELLGDVEGEAMCIGCRKTVPKAGLYYNKSLDVYYHPQCLARDRSK